MRYLWVIMSISNNDELCMRGEKKNMNKKQKGIVIASMILAIAVAFLFSLNAIVGSINPYESYEYGKGGGVAASINRYRYEKVGDKCYYQHITKDTLEDGKKYRIPSILFNVKGVIVRCMNFEKNNGYDYRDESLCDGMSYGIELRNKNGKEVNLHSYSTSWSLNSEYNLLLIELLF